MHLFFIPTSSFIMTFKCRDNPPKTFIMMLFVALHILDTAVSVPHCIGPYIILGLNRHHLRLACEP